MRNLGGLVFLILVCAFASTSQARVNLREEFAGREKDAWPQLLNMRLRAVEGSLQADDRSRRAEVQTATAELRRLGEIMVAMAPYRWEFFNLFDFTHNYFMILRIQDSLPADHQDTSLRALIHDSFKQVVTSVVLSAGHYINDYDQVVKELSHRRYWRSQDDFESWGDSHRGEYPTRSELSVHSAGARPEGKAKLQQLKDLKAQFDFQMEALIYSYDEERIASGSRGEAEIAYSALGTASAIIDQKFLGFLSATDLGHQIYVTKIREIKSATCSILLQKAPRHFR